MNLSLPPQLRKYVAKKVRHGAFRTGNDVVLEALRTLQHRDLLVGDKAKGRARGFPGPTSPLFTGAPPGADIETLVFIVLMQATNDADEDLKSVMAGVKAITAAKQALRAIQNQVNKDVAANAGQTNGKPPLSFRSGMGSEKAYHQAQIPFPDPGSKGGVRFVQTDLFPGAIVDLSQLVAVQDDLNGRLDGMSAISEMTSLRLQMLLDRRSTFISTLSNVLKKFSETQEDIAQNLK